MATLSASRRSTSGAAPNSPRPSISGSLYSGISNGSNTSRMSSVNEEDDEESRMRRDCRKDPRSCNERSDSGFSECSTCSSVSVPCVCTVPLFDKISEEQNIVEVVDIASTLVDDLNKKLEEIVHVDHSSECTDIKSEISSLELEEFQKTPDSSIAESLLVPSLKSPKTPESPDLQKPLSDIEKRKISLENVMNKPVLIKQEFSLEKLKKTSKVAQLMEKFNSPEKEEITIKENVKTLSFRNETKIPVKSITNTQSFKLSSPIDVSSNVASKSKLSADTNLKFQIYLNKFTNSFNSL